MSQAIRRRTGGDLDQLPEPVLAIETEDPELFDLQPFRDGCQMGGNRFGSVKCGCSVGRFLHHPSAHLDQGGQLPGLAQPDPLQSLKISRLPTGQSGNRPGLGDQLGSETQGRMPIDASVKQKSDQFRVAECTGTVVFKPLLGLFATSNDGCLVQTVEVKR